MNNENHNQSLFQGGRFKHFALEGAKITGAVIALSVLVLWSWNMFAPDMLGLDAIRMKQALGLVIFAGVFAALFRAGHHSRFKTASQGHSQES